MNSILITFIVFLSKQNSSWINQNTWNCLNNITQSYLSNNSLVLLSDTSTDKLFTNDKLVYISHIPSKRISIDVIIIYKNLNNWKETEIHGRIILITESLDNVTKLWTKFKLIDVLIILQMYNKTELYTWYPYKEENCKNNVRLEHIDTYISGKFNKNVNLNFPKLPKQFSKCPLTVIVTPCPPFTFEKKNGEIYGPEIDILNDVARQVNMTIILIDPDDFYTYYKYSIKDGKYYGMFKYLNERTVDLAGNCVSMHIDKIPFEFLPSHLQDTVTWFLPGPRPRKLAYGFITAFPINMWFFVGLSFISVVIFACLAAPKNSFISNFLWTFERFLALPNSPLRKSFIIIAFGYVLELYILVITAIYRSLILYQLYKVPMFTISTAEEGIQNNLKAIIRPRDAPYINQTDLSFWSKILVAGKYNISLALPYDLLVINKSAMLLARTVLDEALIRLQMNKINYKTAVKTQRDHFMTIDMAYFLPASHPLASLLSAKLLNVVASGLSNIYLERVMEGLPGNGLDNFEDEDMSLSLPQMLTLFYLVFISLSVCSIVFGIEIVYFKFRIRGLKRKLINSHLAVNACLAPVCSMHGVSVTTVEGIGSTKTRLHPVQERIAKAHGSQCGFCTPGIVMSMYALLRTMPKPTLTDMEIAFQGNLCRCTGYRPIIEGFRSFTEDWEVARVGSNGINGSNGVNGGCGMGDKCCKKMKSSHGNPNNEEILFNTNEFTPYDPTQEPIFPPELKMSSKLDEEYLVVKGSRATWYRPTSFNEMLSLKSKFPQAKIIVGNTEVGVEVKFKNCIYPVLIQPICVSELTSIETTERGIRVGAAVTLNDIRDKLKQELSERPEFETRILKAIVDMLHWFAGKQIRNVGALGGNIMTGSPISDMNPILLAAEAPLIVESCTGGEREICFNEKFFTGYRRNIISENEVLKYIIIPFSTKNQYFYAYKQARRRDDDIAIVNCAANVIMKPNSKIIEKINLAYGGMAPITVLALKTRQKIIGKEWNESTLEEMHSSLIEDLPLGAGAPGGMIQYRRALTLSLALKVYLEVTAALAAAGINVDPIPDRLKSAATGFHTKELKSSQYFQVVPKSQANIDPVGRPLVHLSAYKQATGEAVYCDDIPHFDRELYLTLVPSTEPYARIVSVDASRALEQPGVVAFYSQKDLNPSNNELGAIFHDEEVFSSKEVTSQSCIIGAIVAEDQITAQRAAKLVKVEYEKLSPVIITIEDAIREKSYFFPPKTIEKGNTDEGLKSGELVSSGEVRMGGQEHFYLETHCSVAIPKEDNEIEVYSSTQHAAETQKFIALVLGIPFNRVYVRVKRMGGGFGGKESRANAIAVPVALAAHRLGRPVRCMLDRDEDMMLSGGRHPFLGRYNIAFTKEGRITALQMDLFNNAGCSTDLSTAVMDRAAFHCMNSYNIEHIKVTGHVCKTNLPSNTAFRGFGGPQGMFFAENVVRDVAHTVGKPVHEIISMNLFNEGDVTHYNQTLEYCTLRRCFDECMEKSNYQNLQKEIVDFNKANRYKKRGMSVVPTMFGIAFTELFLNQAGALVHVYTDGSVLLSHGGTEMGQGLHTKMTQVASRVLGIPASDIYIADSSTDKVPNTGPTAASSGSDLNGMAVLKACETILERIQPYKEKNPKGNWLDWVKAAHLDRVGLSSTGFYKTPDIGYNHKTNEGKAFNYFTYGVATSIVEIDCLTGDHQVLRTDIVMDLGESLNPAIDIGQIEGAFVQGCGLFTLEELVYSPTGVLFTRGPGTYKVPGFADIPAEFNVSLLRGAPNPRAVFSSKAVGEPPLFLASSVFFAIREAVSAAREEVGKTEYFRFDSPATAARIRMACQDSITNKFPEPDPKTYKPWNIVA